MNHCLSNIENALMIGDDQDLFKNSSRNTCSLKFPLVGLRAIVFRRRHKQDSFFKTQTGMPSGIKLLLLMERIEDFNLA